MRARHFVPLLLICIPSVGCAAGDKEPGAEDGPPPTATEVAHFDRLRQHGRPVVVRASGMPAVDKSEPWTEGASCASCTSCTSKLPPPPSPQPARPGRRLAALRKESAYPRAEGVTWYPHPDPVTARTDDRTATSEQWADLKTHHAPALKKCRTPR